MPRLQELSLSILSCMQTTTTSFLWGTWLRPDGLVSGNFSSVIASIFRPQPCDWWGHSDESWIQEFELCAGWGFCRAKAVVPPYLPPQMANGLIKCSQYYILLPLVNRTLNKSFQNILKKRRISVSCRNDFSWWKFILQTFSKYCNKKVNIRFNVIGQMTLLLNLSFHKMLGYKYFLSSSTIKSF